MYPTVYLNGRYLPKTEAHLHVSDLAILRGYGVFDYFRYVDGQPVFVKDHIRRFFRSAELLDLELPVTAEELTEVVHQLIKRNGEERGGIRFVLTGGYTEDAYSPQTPNLIAMAYPFTPPPPRMYQQGCNVYLHAYERQLPEAKTIDYVEGIRIQPMLRREGYDYALYVDREGYVRESDRSNYLMVKDGELLSPDDDILRGITRHHALRLAEELGIPVAKRPLHRSELAAADELIICSSTKGVMPITSVDRRPVADGQPGPITRRLMAHWPVPIAGNSSVLPS